MRPSPPSIVGSPLSGAAVFLLLLVELTVGNWSQWSVAFPCDRSCGGGEEIYRRRCLSPSLDVCNGRSDALDIRPCNEQPCQEPTTTTTLPQPITKIITVPVIQPAAPCQCSAEMCRWLDWGEWTQCTKTCGYGTMSRRRKITGAEYCFGSDKELRLCSEHLCPSWGTWRDWTVCTPNCSAEAGRGTRFRTRKCISSTSSPAACQCDADGKAGAPVCGTQTTACRTASIEHDNRVCGRQAATEPPKAIHATINQGLGTGGSVFVAVCAAAVMVLFFVDCNFTTMRVYHLPEELCLIAGHVGLVIMGSFDDNRDVCYSIIGYLNGFFMLYFLLLLFEAIHILSYVSHVVARRHLIPLWLQYILVLLFVGIWLTIILYYWRDAMIIEAEDRKLCWVRMCVPNADQLKGAAVDKYGDVALKYIASEENVPVCMSAWPGRTWLVVHALLAAVTLVATESAMVQRRHYPYPLPGTDAKQYKDAQLAWSGMYLKTLLSYLSTFATVAAHQNRVETPNNPTIYMWSTLALALCIALGCCIVFYHSLGNAHVRDKIMRKLAECFPCCFKNEPLPRGRSRRRHDSSRKSARR